MNAAQIIEDSPEIGIMFLQNFPRLKTIGNSKKKHNKLAHSVHIPIIANFREGFGSPLMAFV
jgi:hypothetical protein